MRKTSVFIVQCRVDHYQTRRPATNDVCDSLWVSGIIRDSIDPPGGIIYEIGGLLPSLKIYGKSNQTEILCI
jgi:hypothetical protein